jgi:hypothetical protein
VRLRFKKIIANQMVPSGMLVAIAKGATPRAVVGNRVVGALVQSPTQG